MQTEVEVSRTDIGDGLEVVVSRVHNSWEAEVFEDLNQFIGQPTFLDKLINAVAQFRYDRIYGEGRFGELSQEERQHQFELASEFVTAVRDLGHLLN